MASKDLKEMASRLLADLEKTADKAEKSVRKELERQEGQILIINRTRFSLLLTQLVPRLRGKKNQKLRNKIWDTFSDRVKKLENRISKDTLIDLKNTKLPGLRKNDYVFYVKTYATAQRAKGQILKKVIQDVLEKEETFDSFTEKESSNLNLLGGKDNKFGAQLGHEEAGYGVPTSGVRVARLKQMSGGIAANVKIKNIIAKYEQTLGLKIDHKQIIDASLGLQKTYVPILSWQKAIDNNTQSRLEQSALNALEEELKNIANLKGSTSLKDGISQVLLYEISPKKAKVTGKRKKSIREKSSGKSSKKTNSKKTVKVIRDDSIDAASIPTSKVKKSQYSMTALLGALNQQLPGVIAKNMVSPRLNYQTGRFASSVQVTDIATTAKGFPSIGYTYDKYPYQTFEPGYRQGSVERDPRKLIDTSIREIATQFAIGRFYTRRV